MAVLLVILMIGVTPAFAADSSVNQQTVTSTAVKETSNDIGDASDLTGEDSGYIDGYDDDGNYIGQYTVVDPSDYGETSDEDSIHADESDDADSSIVSSFNAPDSGENGDYIDESDNNQMVNLASINQFDEDNNDEFNADDTNQPDNNGDYLAVDELNAPDISDGNEFEGSGNYAVNELNVPDQPDENDDQLIDDNQLDGNGDYIITEMCFEFEYNEYPDINQLNEDLDDSELCDGNYSMIKLSNDQLSEGETAPQIDTNVSTNCKPLLLTIVNGLCGVVQATLKGVGNVCMVLGNDFETIL